MTKIEQLWEYACSGNIKALKQYYNSEEGSINNRYIKFGEAHSLIMGAFRNNQFETVRYLMEQGEKITPKEHKEIEQELNRIDIMKRIRNDYLGIV